MSVPTLDELTKRLEDTQAGLLPDQRSMDKLTLHYLTNRSWAASLREIYQELEDGLAGIDVLKASGSKLDAIVKPVLPGGRIPGGYATGQVTFISSYPATADISIPAGTICYAILENGEKLLYETTEDATLVTGRTDVTAAVRAKVRGISSNIGPMQILQMSSYIPGISSCENILHVTGGSPDETDDELRLRYYEAIKAPGNSTTPLLIQGLKSLSGVADAIINSYGSGDIGIVVDYSGGIAAVSSEIVSFLRANIGGGIQSRGCLAATIVGANAVITNEDVYGGLIWVRPLNHVAVGETLEIVYYDMNLDEQTATVVVPSATHRGVFLATEMASAGSRAKSIKTAPPSQHGNSYDVLLGMGEDGILYNLPEIHSVDITLRIRVTDTPEVGLIDTIEASLTDFIAAFAIGEALEYSDVLRLVFNKFDPACESSIGRPLVGIDEIVELVIVSDSNIANKIGDKISIEDDGRFEPGTISIIVVED